MATNLAVHSEPRTDITANFKFLQQIQYLEMESKKIAQSLK